MCLHSLRSPCDFFQQQNGTVLTETIGKLLGHRIIFTNSTQKLHHAHTNLQLSQEIILDAQAGLLLCCSPTPEDRFSCDEAHILL